MLLTISSNPPPVAQTPASFFNQALTTDYSSLYQGTQSLDAADQSALIITWVTAMLNSDEPSAALTALSQLNASFEGITDGAYMDMDPDATSNDGGHTSTP